MHLDYYLLGIPLNAIRVLLTCLCTMQFCLRTGFGESEELFGGSEAAHLCQDMAKVTAPLLPTFPACPPSLSMPTSEWAMGQS